jgi:putative endonuclease
MTVNRRLPPCPQGLQQIISSIKSRFFGLNRTDTGSEGEAAACRALIDAGFRILDRNWRRPWGEIDIIAERGGILHFVEVKTSAARAAGFEPFLRADRRKMQKVERTARTWLAVHGHEPTTEWQMDVVSVIMGPSGPEIEHFENI